MSDFVGRKPVLLVALTAELIAKVMFLFAERGVVGRRPPRSGSSYRDGRILGGTSAESEPAGWRDGAKNRAGPPSRRR